LLIRMRSQVQVLAGPPAIVAGQSAAGSELGALAAGLGRAGAARPSPPARPVAPPGPPTRTSGSATTTHRGRAPSPRTPATRRLPPPRAAACTRAHRAAAHDGRSARRPDLPGRSAGKRDRRGPHPTRPPGSATDLPTDQRDFGSVPRVPASSTIDRAVDGPAATGASTCSVVTVARPPRLGPQRHRLRWEETDASGPTGADTRRLDTGRADTRRVDSGRLDAGWVDSRRPTAGPSGRRPQVTGHRTAGQRIPDAETGWVDTACWTPATDAVACLLAMSTTATTPELSIPAATALGWRW
jgi:hypothetical protein